MSLVIPFSGIFLIVIILMIGVGRKPKPKSLRPVTAEWLAEMSVDRYRPMLRLLDPHDLQFLAAQPGARSGLIARVRKQRCAAFGRYLANLSVDFDRAMHLAKAVPLQNGPKGREWRSLLARTRRQFARRAFFTRCRLPLYRCLGMGRIHADGLVERFEVVAAELHLAAMPAQPQEFGFQMSTSHFQRPSSCLQ